MLRPRASLNRSRRLLARVRPSSTLAAPSATQLWQGLPHGPATTSWDEWCATPVGTLLDPDFISELPNIISKTSTAHVAAQTMVNMRKSYLLVVDSNENTTYMPLHKRPLLGIATERALLSHALDDLSAPVSEFVAPMSGRCRDDTSPMPEALCASPSDTVGHCLALMHDKIYRHLPVLADDGAPLGILKLRDLLRPLKPAEASAPGLGGGAAAPADKLWWDAMVRRAAAEGSVQPRSVEAGVAKVQMEAMLAAIEHEAQYPHAAMPLLHDPPVGDILAAKRSRLGVCDEAAQKM